MVIWMAFTASKCTKNRFSAEAPPRTTLMELTMLPRPPNRMGRGHPSPYRPSRRLRSSVWAPTAPRSLAYRFSTPFAAADTAQRTPSDSTLLYRQPPSLLLFTRRLPEGTTARRAQRTDLSHFARSSRSGANTTPAVYRAYFTHRRRSAVIIGVAVTRWSRSTQLPYIEPG